MGGTEAAGQGQRPLRRAVSSRGRAPGDSGPARICGLDALPSRVTPAAACPLPSQVWAAVGGAGVETSGWGPSTLGRSSATPVPKVPGEEGVPARRGRGGCAGAAAGSWGCRTWPQRGTTPSHLPRGLAPPCLPPKPPLTASFGISKPCSLPQLPIWPPPGDSGLQQKDVTPVTFYCPPTAASSPPEASTWNQASVRTPHLGSHTCPHRQPQPPSVSGLSARPASPRG